MIGITMVNRRFVTKEKGEAFINDVKHDLSKPAAKARLARCANLHARS
jgi:hypothetical protein